MLFSSMSGLKFVTTFASCSNPFCIRHSGYMSQVRFLPSLNLDSDFSISSWNFSRTSKFSDFKCGTMAW